MTDEQIPLHDQITGFSRALFSTWIYHKRFNILFDAGEGVSTSLYNRVFGIRRIFLSHGHADHIAGLVNLLNIRNLGAGNQTAELKIYYPKNNFLIEVLKDYLDKTQGMLSFNLQWVPITAKFAMDLEDKKGRLSIRSFKTKHSQKQLSLGYNIIETRRKLKSDFIGKSQIEIKEAIQKFGKDSVSEDFEKIVFTYGGDSRPISPANIENSMFLCHECTYMCSEDDERNFQQHSVLDDVLKTAKAAKVEILMLFHTSLRYNLSALKSYIRKSNKKIQPGCRILLLYGDKLLEPISSSIDKNKPDKPEQILSEEK